MTEAASGMRALMAPRSIAVVGASDSPSRIGGRIVARLKETYEGNIVPVNPTRDTVQDLPARPSITDLDFPTDLAIVATPATNVVSVARECAAKGVRAMLVLSAGFAETGEAGARLQAELAEVTSAAGIRVCGPNCIGMVNLTIGLRAVFSSIQAFQQRPGNVAVVSQSGAYGMTLYELAQTAGLGVSYVFAAGNESGVTCGEALGYLVEQPDVQTVALFVEGIRKTGHLIAAARRALELGKPVVGIKVGRSQAGIRAAASHTGAMAVPSKVVDAVFDELGVVRVRTARELIDCLTVFSASRVPAGRNLAVMTISGGVGVSMADAAATAGLALPPANAQLRDELAAVIPEFGSAANPVDVTAQVVNDQSKIHTVLGGLISSPDYDMITISGAPRGLGQQLLDSYQKAFTSTDKPMVIYGPQADVNEQLMLNGIPTISDPVATIDALGRLCSYHDYRRERLAEPAPATPALSLSHQLEAVSRTLSEEASRSVIEQYGVPFARQEVVADPEAAVAAAERLGGPVVLKLCADWLPHKSEHGAVLVGLRGLAEVAAGFGKLAEIHAQSGPAGAELKVLVQEQIPAGIELACGALRDPTFGPMVSLGLGGVLVDILGEQHLRMAPVTERAAASMLSAIAGGRLVNGRRAISNTAARAVTEILMGIGQLIASEPAIAEIDLNPVIVTGDRVTAADALIVTGH